MAAALAVNVKPEPIQSLHRLRARHCGSLAMRQFKSVNHCRFPDGLWK